MKSIFKKIVTGALACGVILSVGACRTNKPGGDPNEEWHEDSIKNITLFCNDWEQFNNGAAVNSPVYKKLKAVTKCDIVAKSTGLETYYSTLDLMRNKGSLTERTFRLRRSARRR